MAPRTRRALLSVTAFLATCAALGNVYSRQVSAQSASDESTLRDSLHAFTNVYSVVEQNYAEKMDSDRTDKAIYDGAIPGMLHVLDPHSNFYDPKAFAQMREDQHGRYYGVGMTIQPQQIDGQLRVVVLTPFEGTPSFKAGIRPGDVLVSVDGKPTDNLDSAAVAGMLKGPRGTHVVVVMNREGRDKPLSFDLVRDEIPRASVDLAFELKPGIGYMHVTNFMETTSKEVGDALDKFRAQGDLKGLVIDLRGNPGGLLNEAVNMSDKFLQKGQTVVSQHGRSFADQSYRASHGEQGTRYPIVVLVNRNTASAAEIVSGALQDHDRALIVGETTFGKGLVQTVFSVSQNTGLALTTFHYYTPSGRLIQRPYDHMSLYDYYYVRDAAKPSKDNANREVKLTDDGRTVYGGGGITPDEHIDPIKANHFQDELLQHYAFFNFSKHYLADKTVAKDFVVDDAVLAQFKDFMKTKKIDYTDADVATNIDWVKESIKAELFTSQFGQLEGLKVRAEWDPQINKSLTYMSEAQALEEHQKINPNAKPVNTASR
ncbi:S41 family peptidase [Granulicella sp. WH15]|uniref:S41 family peptidase n=1 Tax=Granulicella sp. WH15 TaxID=2602070 RepID=UPI0013671867|nr:S41 family peptidase [Granulicella sp. WH15]QHN04573.1 S41 family peptidase [Granulicella sp. WH15]